MKDKKMYLPVIPESLIIANKKGRTPSNVRPYSIQNSIQNFR